MVFFLEGTIICYHGNSNSGKDVGLRLCEPQKIRTRVVSYQNNYFCIKNPVKWREESEMD